jgi:hypothetical protein
MPMKKQTQYHAWYWVAVMVAVMAIQAICVLHPDRANSLQRVPAAAESGQDQGDC